MGKGIAHWINRLNFIYYAELKQNMRIRQDKVMMRVCQKAKLITDITLLIFLFIALQRMPTEVIYRSYQLFNNI